MVYVLQVEIDYEGSRVVGVYSSLEDARRAGEGLHNVGDAWFVQEWELGVQDCDRWGILDGECCGRI